MTYFLEKHYHVDDDGKLSKARYGFAVIRPCKWSYEQIIDWMNDNCKDTPLTLEGQVAYYPDHSSTDTNFVSLEEWLINLELEKNLKPDFEETNLYEDCSQMTNYIVKTIDLHTNKAIYDQTEKAIKKILSARNGEYAKKFA